METSQSGLEARPLVIKEEESWPVREYCSASMGEGPRMAQERGSQVLNGRLDHGGLDGLIERVEMARS